MPYRMFDYECPACTHRWEELTVTTSSGEAPLPRCPRCRRSFAKRLIGAPAIRTTDNMPRELRMLSTDGRPAAGTIWHPTKGWVDAQLGVPVNSRDDIPAGKTTMAAADFESTYLQNPDRDITPKEYCDDPQNLEQVLADADEMWERAEAGTLPPVERPMTETFERETGASIAEALAPAESSIAAEEAAP